MRLPNPNLLLFLMLAPAASESATLEASDYAARVQAYAEAMIAEGRDVYGAQESPLFAAALDREEMKIGSFPAIKGVRESDRSLTGANPQQDVAL